MSFRKIITYSAVIILVIAVLTVFLLREKQQHVKQEKIVQGKQKEPVHEDSGSYVTGPVAVLLTSDIEAYTKPADVFIAKIGIPSEVFNLHGDTCNACDIIDEILSVNPVLIFALGAKASYLAKTLTADHPDIPVIFGMVINWKKYRLYEDQENIVGIPYVAAPDIQFIYLKMFTPDVKHVGVVYSKMHSCEIINDAEDAAILSELELITEPIVKSEDFRSAYRSMTGHIDAFWILADPVLYTPRNMDWLIRQCIRDNIFCFGHSKNIVKLGALLAVIPDNSDVGSQGVSIAKRILLKNESLNNIRGKYHPEIRIFLNMKTAKKIGLEISKSAMEMTSGIIK
ncbi:MAG: hypothetical protein GY749_27710 [Desulfobacteraceae bacterium]|nr:hypothetical protein [Desulfobacteraceae bacterium]